MLNPASPRPLPEGRPSGFAGCLAVACLLVVAGASAAAATSHRFVTLEPGSELPSGAACAELVRRSAGEPRPQNERPNHTQGITGVNIDGAADWFNEAYAGRVDGAFTGTTDEIIQWASCKWGFDEDITRARAVQESYWRQSEVGDRTEDTEACAAIGQSSPCWQSYGLLQVKGPIHDDTYPVARDSTAFNVDYALSWLRACYEGAFSEWLPDDYAPGSEWGCVGAWFSGEWYDPSAKQYIEEVRVHLTERVWEQPDF
jgi:autotransporter family porin